MAPSRRGWTILVIATFAFLFTQNVTATLFFTLFALLLLPARR